MPVESNDRKISYRREIYWPILGAVFVVLVGLVIILLLQRRVQVSLVADWMFTTIVLLPTLLCAFAIYLGLLVTIVWVARMNRRIEQALQQGVNLSERANTRSANLSAAIDSMTIRLVSWFGITNKLLKLLEPEEMQDRKADNDE